MFRCCDDKMKNNECVNMCPPIYECPQEKICERYIVHEVPQV